MHHAAGRECFVYSRTDFYAREWDWREKMKKAVFFDIDGTLWNEHMQVPESTTKAIRELRNAGNYAFLCSGRSRSNIRSEKILGIGFDGLWRRAAHILNMKERRCARGCLRLKKQRNFYVS